VISSALSGAARRTRTSLARAFGFGSATAGGWGGCGGWGGDGGGGCG
jgi:hypothetical protein